MKTKTIVIVILIIVIAAQFIQYILLLRRFDRLKLEFEYEVPVQVYVAGLTERVREIENIRSTIIWQNHWLSKRLYKCIELLELQEGLEP